MNTPTTFPLRRPAVLALPVLLAAMLAACAQGGAAPGGPSLYQRRLEIVDPARPAVAAPEAPAAAAMAGTAPAGAASGGAPGAAPRAAQAASSPGFLQGIREKMGPPSGRPMNDATQLKASDLGITVPSEKARAAATAASAASR